MLLQFRAKNYRSIGDEVSIDLTAGRGQEHKDSIIEQNNVKILPVISIYGSNASGKTNVISAMTDMLLNIVLSYKNGNDVGDMLHVTPFLYDDDLVQKPTEMELFFVLGKHEYQYGYKATSDKVHEEWLWYRTLSKSETVRKPIFEREGQFIQFAKPDVSLSLFSELVGAKTLALSFFGTRDTNKVTKAGQIFVDILLWVKKNIYFPIELIEDETVHQFYDTFHNAKDSLKSFLHEFDPCIEDIDWKLETSKDGLKSYKIFTKHNNRDYPLDIESMGTQRLIKIYMGVFIALNLGRSIMIYDELDRHLHPLILRRIVNMFHDKSINKFGSQLIFSSHNLIVLDKYELRRDEIWFVEKDERGFTTAYSLDSFKSTKEEIRADMDYGKHYLYGRFGAIPYAKPRRK